VSAVVKGFGRRPSHAVVTGTRAVVRKPPVKEPAVCGVWTVPPTLWGLRQRGMVSGSIRNLLRRSFWAVSACGTCHSSGCVCGLGLLRAWGIVAGAPPTSNHPNEDLNAHRPSPGQAKVQFLDASGAVADFGRDNQFRAGAAIGQAEHHLLGVEPGKVSAQEVDRCGNGPRPSRQRGTGVCRRRRSSSC
jgi:hypothetical protein